MSSPFRGFPRPRGGRGRSGSNYSSSRGGRDYGSSSSSRHTGQSPAGRSPTRSRYSGSRYCLVAKEGDVVSQDGLGRRAFVKNFPKLTTISDLKLLFGADSIEGIALYSNNYSMYAVIQFKLPSLFTEALEKNGDKFYEKTLIVKRYDDLGARMRQRNSQDTPRSTVDEDIERSRRIREGDDSPIRSRSSSPSSVVSSIAHMESVDDREQQQQLQTTCGSTFEPHATSSRHQDDSPLPVAEQTLPADVESNLKSVLRAKSARMLTVEQLNRTIKYFTIERAHVKGEEPEGDMDDEEEEVDEATRKMIESTFLV